MRPLAIACFVLCACGSGSSTPAAPVITSFASSAGTVAAGGSVQLTAVFSGGTGAIDHGVGAVTSGTAVTVSPTQNTTYTLTVTDAKTAATSTASATVIVTGGAACIGSSLLSSLGKTHLMAGVSADQGSPASVDSATWDLRYIYLAGGIFDQNQACTTCASNCTSNGTACNNYGCGWWGCYQLDPPGLYAENNIKAAKAESQIMWFSYYEILQTSNPQSYQQEVAAVNNAGISSRILSDLKLLFTTIGNDTAFVHVEPDFWGYAQLVNSDPTKIPAQVSQFSDCSSQPNTLTGFVGCIFSMARHYAPNAKIGLHGSSWGTGTDVTTTTSAMVDPAAEGKKLATFMAALGAGAGDFIAVDASDRDAGYYASVGSPHAWDANNVTLPDFHQNFAWAQSLAENLGVPVIYWQVPVGNSSQNNTTNHWVDNRVDYFYAHPTELAAAHVAAMLFGAGRGDQTTPETDGGNLTSREKTYQTSPQALCQ